MTDPLEKLEAELAGLRPRETSAELVERIESRLASRDGRSRGDRMLLAAMSAGAMAACVIVAMLVMDLQIQMPAAPPSEVVSVRSGFGGAPLAFARADAGWIDSLK